MKVKYLTGTFVVLIALFMSGCKKEKIETPDLSVTVEKTTFKAGEPVIFNLEGNPDFISFYSGEYGNDYAFIGGRTLDIKSLSLLFQTRVRNGNQPNQFTLHLSSDFNGKYDIESIRAGSFKDITNLFTLSSENTVWTSSGQVDLTPIITDRTKPLYIGFRYIVKPQTATSGPNGTQRNWDVRDLTLKTVTDVGETNAIDQLSAAWTLVESGAVLEAGRNTITEKTGAITMRGNATAAGKLVETEAWAISKAVDLNTIILGPDRGIAVKSISETIIPVYRYVYNKPGTYKAVFEVNNSRITGAKQVLKEITFTITP